MSLKFHLFFSTGIYDLYIDFPQQKLTIIGWADPERIMKAIKKTRKVATICSHTEVADPAAPPPSEPPPQEGSSAPPPAPDAGPSNPPSAEAPPPPPSKEPPPPENPTPEPMQPTPPPVTIDTNAGEPGQPSRPKELGEVHVVYHHPPPEYGYRYGYGHGYAGYWNRYQNGQGPQEPAPAPAPVPPVYVTHSYNTYKPSSYVTEYEYIRSPPRQPNYTRIDPYYTRNDHYNEEQQYYVNGNNGNGNITSIFSDENPNACIIV